MNAPQLPLPPGPFRVVDGAVEWRGDGETLRVDAWGPGSVRVRASRVAPIDDDRWALLDPVASDPQVVVEGDRATLTNGTITVMMQARTEQGWQTSYPAHTCRLTFLDVDGDILFEELHDGGALQQIARHHRPRLGGRDVRLTAAFEAPAGERLAGMGQYQQDIIDVKGSTFELAHRNSQVSVPFVLSDRGYGFLWHNPAIGRATFATNRTEWVAESTQQLDYWVTAGSTPATILRAYADATGHVPEMPEYGLGLWQSRLRYWNQQQVLDVAREHVRRGIPLDVLVIDFFHWPEMGDYRFEDEFWPDPTAMVDELRSHGIETMVSVWPQVSLQSENYDRMRQENLLVTADRGIDIQMHFGGASAFIDPTSSEARAFLRDRLHDGYGRHGIKLFWLDEAEPEFALYDFDAYRLSIGPVLQVGNLYPQQFVRAVHEGGAEGTGSGAISLVRAAWAGSQRHGALVWSGDIRSEWQDLRRQITAGIQMGVAGIPWVTTDIGGFGGGDVEDPGFHELLIRWFQFGAFSPVFRMHGDRMPSAPVTAADGSLRSPTGAPNELWSYGDDVLQVLRRYVQIRERLRPYLREVMHQAHVDGLPVVRGLFVEFPDDRACWSIADQYMLGGDILVAPVHRTGVDVRDVYLPAGAAWTELASGRVHEGGSTISAAAPTDTIPVFLRDDRRPELLDLLSLRT
ncbi:family 31 glucosidase [Clavibacter michiganensis]|uniref:glycoside hydrolase family 31 protein n=1 Tax=Clavibacter michiganensis TaxID=28447 RepID=UPI000CE80021|nr:family 31 glucosidase [Clavibacter michiganensis]